MKAEASDDVLSLSELESGLDAVLYLHKWGIYSKNIGHVL
ncbi:protein of unknown function [Vibrio tapetis subsp. tapetis]|uniref:Uncharacterized protein n=1 Tax=Vibrio tapetis subsp. tapetis TaxID=1671868 RepID=A0A2N8ZED8_9VIBR|nr:protein of unknown function [Vibrio tapetis subsp. tapetis]